MADALRLATEWRLHIIHLLLKLLLCLNPSKGISQIPTPPEFKPCEFLKARHFGGLMSLVLVPRFGVPSVGTNFSFLRDRLCLWNPSLLCTAMLRVKFLGKHCIVYHLDCGPFILCCGRGCWANFQVFSSGNYSICSCGFGVSIGVSEIKGFLHYNLMICFKNKQKCKALKCAKKYIEHLLNDGVLGAGSKALHETNKNSCPPGACSEE